MNKLKLAMRWLLGVLFVLAGGNHFVQPDPYVKIVPPYLPWHLELVYVSGFFEMALGALLLVPRYTTLAAWGLIALLIGVFPANVQMALNPELYPTISPVALWLRLPLQGALLAWAFWFTRRDDVGESVVTAGTAPVPPPDGRLPLARLTKRRGCLLAGLGGLGALLVACGQPTFLLLRARFRDRPVPDDLPPNQADDASRLERTEVAEVWDVPAAPAEAEAQMRALLRRARAQALRVSIAGARHSMGGHTIYPGGIVLNMLPFKRMELAVEKKVLHVGAGARWADVVPYLDAHGLSVSVMQATRNFTVGGSVSVNCHGWQHARPPMASTVRSFRLMKADGSVVRCSRTENAELFSLALGGYGLFGVVLDVELRVVPNERYRPDAPLIFPAHEYAERFREKVEGDEDVTMVYGRINVAPGEKTFLREALLTVFRRHPCPPEEVPALVSPGYATLRRTLVLVQIGSDAGKRLRWRAERLAAGRMANTYFSRNQLLNEDATLYQEGRPERTEVLHEYFVSPDRLEDFLAELRAIVPRHGGDLLNLTVRDVRRDTETFLRYVDRDLFALVLLFSQERTPQGEERMKAMTREMIDAALRCGGRHYLPYRLHATREQFRRAYPQAGRFFERKRFHDPDELFQNRFYVEYGRR